MAEINALMNVYNTFRRRYGTDIGFIMGDYNYGGSYVPSNQQDNLNIDRPPFVRFINKTDGTTVAGNPGQPYDRIYVVPGTITIERAGIDKFMDTLTAEEVIDSASLAIIIIIVISINDIQYFRSVSDHYPVYVEVNFGTSGGTAPQSKGYNIR